MTVLGVLGVLAIGFVVVPVHVSPGNGSIRCGHSLLPGQFQPDDAEGLGHVCRQAAGARTLETIAAAIGVATVLSSFVRDE